MIPAPQDNLQDFAVQTVAALLARTPEWRQATGTDDDQSAGARILHYGARKWENGLEVWPPYPFAVVFVPDGDPDLTDADGGLGIAHDWKCTVIVQILDAYDATVPMGIERERFIRFHGGIIAGMLRQYKSEFEEGEAFHEAGDARIVGYRHTARLEPDPKDNEAQFWEAQWDLSLAGTLG